MPACLRVCILAALLMPAGAARAALQAHDGFDYATVSPINGAQTGGVGFAAGSHWGTTNGSIAAGRRYAGLLTAGNAFRGGGTSSSNFRHARTLAASVGGGSFYISALVNCEGVNQQRLGPELFGGGEGPCFGRVSGGWGMFGPSQGTMGISNSNGGYQTWVGVAAAADNRTHFVVVKIDYPANAIQFWLDPIPDSAEPAPSATLQSGGAWTVNLNSQAFSQLAIFHQLTSGFVDEVRLGSSWQDVVPATPMAAFVAEGFDYAQGVINNTQSGGVGFAAGSYWPSNAINATIVAGLAYPNLVPQGAGAWRAGGNNSPKRYTAEDFAWGTCYVALLVNPQSNNPDRFGVDFQDANGPTFGKVLNGWGLRTGNNGVLGISHSSGNNQRWTGIAAASDNSTHLYVAKLDFAANAVKLYLDPPVNGAEPASPSATLTTAAPWTVNLVNTAFGAVRMVSVASGAIADELRIGRTWGAVVPPLTNVWSQSAGGSYRWVTASNWTGGSVANPAAGSVLDFSRTNLDADVTLALDGDRGAAFWKFGDTAGAQNWSVTAGTPAGRAMLTGAAPVIHVAQNRATFAAALAGSNGFAKEGPGIRWRSPRPARSPARSPSAPARCASPPATPSPPPTRCCSPAARSN